MRHWQWFLSVLLGLGLALRAATACSCTMQHPQDHFCKADFVVLATVQKAVKYGDNAFFKIRIKKEFKVSLKAGMALKAGRLYTAPHESLCGVRLEKGGRYVLAGSLVKGKPWMSLCGYHRLWNELSIKERKGFRLLYRQGCKCKILQCSWWQQCPVSPHMCPWETAWGGSQMDCQRLHSFCVRHDDGKCQWADSRRYRQCMKLRRLAKEERIANEP